ncbi:MAG: ADP-ribosylglycohydrolase family protein [Heteroscytonema crispum UTEX LB 1556]
MVMRRASGCLFGLAFGDALGALTEFLLFDEIRDRFPPNGLSEIIGNPARVTDDTQMTLAVGKALVEAGGSSLTAQSLEKPLIRAFVEWLQSPDNNRAPGRTCLRACLNFKAGMTWYKATVENSKGCGANMRVAPVGLLPLGEQLWAIAQFQAALTHGHRTALAASDLTAYAIADLFNGGDWQGLTSRIACLCSQPTFSLPRRLAWFSVAASRH